MINYNSDFGEYCARTAVKDLSELGVEINYHTVLDEIMQNWYCYFEIDEKSEG